VNLLSNAQGHRGRVVSPPRFDQEFRVTSAIDTDLWCATRGQGPAIVLCDGLGCDGYVWKYTIGHFAKDHQVVRWHYRGHGRSEAPADLREMCVEGLAEDLRLVLDRLEIDQAILVGHSMGVQVILEAALTSMPERVAGLILLCGAPGRPLDTFKNTSLGLVVFPQIRALAMRYPVPFQRGWRAMLRSPLTLVVTRLFEINAALVDVQELKPYLERLATMDPRAFLAMLADASTHSAEPRLGELRTPTLVVGAERDTFTPLRRSKAMQRAIPDAEFFLLPDATHTGPLEWPELLNLRMRKFLRTRGLGAYGGDESAAL